MEGEPREIYPFLGSSRLEEPLSRYPVTVVFHGHAHHGRPECRMRGQVPVYNVCLPLLQREAPDRPPFLLIDLDRLPVNGTGPPDPSAATAASVHTTE